MSAPAPLRIASYNLRGLKDDTAAAARVVRAVDPDVLLLQEVPRHPLSSYRIADFARRAGLLWSGRTRRLSGTTLMTSLRVRSTDSTDHRLPVPPGGNPRSYTTARVGRPGARSLTVVGVHLSLVAAERVAHTRQVLAEVAADPELSGGPLVVGGDLNESTEGAAWQLLAGVLRVATAESPTFPAHRPHRWIDAVFTDPSLEVLTDTRPVELDRAVLTAATDHLPVWVDVLA